MWILIGYRKGIATVYGPFTSRKAALVYKQRWMTATSIPFYDRMVTKTMLSPLGNGG